MNPENHKPTGVVYCEGPSGGKRVNAANEALI